MAKGSGSSGRGGFSSSSGEFSSAPKGWSLGGEPGNINYNKRNRIWRNSKDKRNTVIIQYSRRKNDFFVAKQIGYNFFFDKRFAKLKQALSYGNSL